MTINTLVKKTRRLLRKTGMASAELVDELYDSRSFGNALATYRLGVFVMKFVRDRDDETVDIGSVEEPDRLYGFLHLAVFRGWIDIEEALKIYDIGADQDEWSKPLFELDEALDLIGRDLENLQELFSGSRLETTLGSLADIDKRFSDAIWRRWEKMGF